MRIFLSLILLCLVFSAVACQRNNRPYAGVDNTQADKEAVQPDPARAGQ